MTDGHLTDEQLSSQVDQRSGLDHDDTAGHGAGEHLAGCAECRHRLAGLEAARDLVRTPAPSVAADVRAASIASVLQAAGNAGLDAHPLADAAHAPVPMKTPRRPQVLVGSAAAVLVLAVAVGVPLALSSRSTSSNSTASAGAERLGQQHQRQAPETAGPSKSSNATIFDLGALDSVGQLRSRVTAALSMDVAAAPSAAAPGPTGAAPTTTGAAPTTTGVIAATATTSTPGTGSSSQSTFNAATALGTAGPFEHCLSSAMHAAGSNRSVQLLASAEFRGTPALVYVFYPASGGSATGNGAHSVAVATAREGCRVLGTTAL